MTRVDRSLRPRLLDPLLRSSSEEPPVANSLESAFFVSASSIFRLFAFFSAWLASLSLSFKLVSVATGNQTESGSDNIGSKGAHELS